MDTRFVKNEKWVREAQQVEGWDEQSDMNKKKIAIVIAGHVGHGQAEIIELLNRQSDKIDAEIVVIQTEVPHQKWSLEELSQELHKKIVIESERICREVSALFFEKERKPQHPNIYYAPKVQRAKLNTRRYIPRKK